MVGTFRRAVGAMAVAGVLATSQLTVAPRAQADPDAVAKAQEALQKIEAESSAIDARYIQLQSQLDDASTALGEATKDLDGQRAEVGELSKHLGQFAMLRYQTSGVDMTTTLLTSDDEADFLNQLSTIQTVTDRANDRVQTLQLAQADLAVTQQEAAQARQRIAKDKAEQAKVAAEYRKKEAEAQQVLDRLTAEEKERLAELERKQEQERQAKAREAIEAARQAEAASASASASASPSASPTPGASPSSSETPTSEADDTAAAAAGSGRASDAVSFALAQVGKSYVMGATGPGAYDCSGLMLRAWGNAGVSLPRTSQAQFGAGSSVATSGLQPGDLVFYYSGISHVGMYIGKGMIVHASNPRTGVKVSPVDSMPVAGARRVG
ncbi:MAG: NlpC/P60 family protein [Luteococcus sp.]|uniref:C40 family peptidase n=1 Tax=Luteococcus sp. TaxID=1969402 RepID=UPI00264829A2|nr:C40 family peptidase [Luteococcus sp.]MDN5564030.1 NlpC/P60 family protein [Luteococcus sp.]